MDLILFREYFLTGTNGQLYNGEAFICFTIELPWKNNEACVSCIPEGRYELKKRYSALFKWHLYLKIVPGRQRITIHPANDALKELTGCIAPVSKLMDPGKGINSQIANDKLKAIVFDVLSKNEQVFITIKKRDT